jgi:hypothetical protein
MSIDRGKIKEQVKRKMDDLANWDKLLLDSLKHNILREAPKTKRDANKIQAILIDLSRWFDKEFIDVIKPKVSKKGYWFNNDPSINLSPKFMDIYNELFGNTISYGNRKMDKAILRAGGTPPYYDNNSKAEVCVIPDYKRIVTKLGISESLVRKYVQAMVDAGILKKLPNKGGPREVYIYAIGYWTTFKDQKTDDFMPRRNEFIRESNPKAREKMREALRNLKIK